VIPVNLVSARASFFICTRGCGCIEHPAFPAPFIEGAKELKEFLQTSGAWRREIVDSCHVCERKRSNPESLHSAILDCFRLREERFGGLQARHSSRERRRVVASAPSNDGFGCFENLYQHTRRRPGLRAGTHNHKCPCYQMLERQLCSQQATVVMGPAGACHRAARSADPVAGTTILYRQEPNKKAPARAFRIHLPCVNARRPRPSSW